MSRLPWMVLVAALSACPPVNSTPCEDDSQCIAEQRCRRGACGPLCIDDSECGSGQVCLDNGTCGARPECSADTECATGFVCTAGRCACEDDSACSANQQCLSGTCQTRPRCTSEADCLGTGGRCEITQGLCLPECQTSADCAPDLDPRVAFVLYACKAGTCTRQCTTDIQCGGAGLICRYGLCEKADCAQESDCPAGQYCTSATFGRCQAYTVCTSVAQCMANEECKRFDANACPPGFDCSQSICQELPRCLSDGDCVSGTIGMQTRSGYCAVGHCQASRTCQTAVSCEPNQDCVGELCVPHVCRGHAECGAGSFCVDGACAMQPAPADVNRLRLTPTTGFVIEGDTLPLSVLAYRIDGTSTPITPATFTVKDQLGQPSTLATVSANGTLTAVTAGIVSIRAGVTGSTVSSNESVIRVLPRLMMGRRVVVVDASTGAPLSGVTVRACASPCITPEDVPTDVDGVAAFPLIDATAFDFTAVASTVRSDGLPTFERVSILGTTVADVLIPLRANPVKASSGFSASIAFSDVRTTGNYWAGFVTASESDVPSMTVQSLLGDSFVSDIPGISQQVPLPGALVLYTSPGLGIAQQIKPKSLGFAQPGSARFVQSWAGRAQLADALTLRSTDVLSYLGGFDYAQDRDVVFTSFPDVDDTSDVDGDLLCSNPARCPMGTEQVPDYARFTPLAYQPRREQQLRTEVIVPGVPQTFAQVLVTAALFDRQAGMLPTGFASSTPGAPGADGFRTVDPITVRGGSAYNGLELARPGLWVLATNAAGTAFTARMTRNATWPQQVNVTAFLPAPAESTYTPATRTFGTGQPAWASVFGTGGELARVSLTGTDVRHTIYVAMSAGQNEVRWPTVPAAPGQDPAAQAMSALEVVAVDLVPTVTVDQVFDAVGLTLATWSEVIDGYSRLDR